MTGADVLAIAGIEPGPEVGEILDELLEEVLGSLDIPCRRLLAAIYRQEATIEELRRELGLRSVQAVYHRRNICLQKAQRFLNRLLFSGRTSGSRKSRPRTLSSRDKESDDG